MIFFENRSAEDLEPWSNIAMQTLLCPIVAVCPPHACLSVCLPALSVRPTVYYYRIYITLHTYYYRYRVDPIGPTACHVTHIMCCCSMCGWLRSLSCCCCFTTVAICFIISCTFCCSFYARTVGIHGSGGLEDYFHKTVIALSSEFTCMSTLREVFEKKTVQSDDDGRFADYINNLFPKFRFWRDSLLPFLCAMIQVECLLPFLDEKKKTNSFATNISSR